MMIKLYNRCCWEWKWNISLQG